MNRRTSIKSLLVFVSLGIPSFSLYKWITYNSVPDISVIHHKKSTIAELAEVIIPRTNTPGAKDAHVEDFIIRMITSCTDPKSQNNFVSGLAELEKYALDNFQHDFIHCTNEQKIKIVAHFEDKSTYSYRILDKASNKFLGKSFFLILKELTVRGYCMSQLGATQGLAYDYIPQTFQGCIPLTKNQRSWATK